MASRNERTETIAELEKEFAGAKGIVLTDYNGIDVEKLTKLRIELRKNGCKYLVVKNTLARKAFDKCGFAGLSDHLKGPTGVAYSLTEPVAPAKAVKDFKTENKDVLNIKGGYVDGLLLTKVEDVMKIADIPSREVLLSQFLSCLQAPMSNFVGVLSNILTKFVGTLEAVKQQKESQTN